MHQLRTAWAGFDAARKLALETRDFATLLLSESRSASVAEAIVNKAEFVLANVPAIVGRVAFIQFAIHSRMRTWFAEGTLQDRSLMEECVTQTRRSIKFLASAFNVRLKLPSGTCAR